MDFIKETKSILDNPPEDINARQEILDAAYKLVQELEPLYYQVQRVLYSNLKLSVVAIAAKGGLLQILGSQPSKRYTTAELAALTNSDHRLLVRVLRYLATNRIIEQDGSDTWSGKPLTRELVREGNLNGIYHQFFTLGPAYQSLPQALEHGQYKNPADPLNAAFVQAYGLDGQTAFQWVGQHPENLKYFTEFLKVHGGQGHWLDTSLSDELIAASQTCNAEDALFVDVGGSSGQNCIDVRQRLGSVTGRVVNQDLPVVIGNKIEHPGVEHQEHDFFTDQPVKGARVYFLSNILHDWPDVEAGKILNRIVTVMNKESEIWLQENVVSVDGASEYSVNQDFTMMTILGAGERTDADWERLLQKADLRLKSITAIPDSSRKVIAAGLSRGSE